MSEIPEELKRQAEWLCPDVFFRDGDIAQARMMTVKAIAKAIWAERQRCAKIAEGEIYNTDVLLSQPPKSSAAFRISQDILKQTEE